MLREIKDYIKEHKKVTLADISIHFDLQSSALEGILQKIESKGNIKIVKAQVCSGCIGCSCGKKADNTDILWVSKA
ncbi:MAG: FeoC-like transcriptional regulator [Verrucomicrobiota bacterium]|nr:FeoC-like transcriptional regulator [Verrucomicrobiota bacterium]